MCFCCCCRYRSLLFEKRQAEEEARSQKKETTSTSDRGSSAEDLDTEGQTGKRLSSEYVAQLYLYSYLHVSHYTLGW